MAHSTISRQDWAEEFRTLAQMEFAILKFHKTKVSDDSVAVSFKIDRGLAKCHNLYLECRFDVFDKAARLIEQERDCVRIVAQLKEEYSNYVNTLETACHAAFDVGFAVRQSQSGNTIYVAATHLPRVNHAELPGRQRDVVIEYARAARNLLRSWNEHVDAIRDALTGCST